MNSTTFRMVVSVIFLSIIFSVSAAFAQEQSGAPAPAVPPAGSQTTASTPNPSASTAGSSGAPASGTQTSPPKRVWTNDDMGGVHRDPSIPNYSATTKPAKNAGKSPVGPKSKDAKRYQDQIAALRAKLPPLNDKIADLQGALNGDTVHSTRTYGGNKIDDWHVELVDLQKKRDDIEAKISALQDEARHNGVPENQIPQ